MFQFLGGFCDCLVVLGTLLLVEAVQVALHTKKL